MLPESADPRDYIDYKGYKIYNLPGPKFKHYIDTVEGYSTTLQNAKDVVDEHIKFFGNPHEKIVAPQLSIDYE